MEISTARCNSRIEFVIGGWLRPLDQCRGDRPVLNIRRAGSWVEELSKICDFLNKERRLDDRIAKMYRMSSPVMTGLRGLNNNHLHTEMDLRDYNDGPNKDNQMVM
jgi:hypothetical protein